MWFKKFRFVDVFGKNWNLCFNLKMYEHIPAEFKYVLSSNAFYIEFDIYFRENSLYKFVNDRKYHSVEL